MSRGSKVTRNNGHSGEGLGTRLRVRGRTGELTVVCYQISSVVYLAQS